MTNTNDNTGPAGLCRPWSRSSSSSTGHVGASSRRSVRIVQKDGRTEVTETREGGSEA